MKFRELLTKNELFDSHCHLNASDYDLDRAGVVKRAVGKGIISIIDIAVDLESTRKALKSTNDFPENVYATAGIDPEVFMSGSDMYVENGEEVYKQFEALIALIEANTDKILMIGETGLDNYWNKKSELSFEEAEISLENQKELFKKHIKLSKTYDLPLTIHSRETVDECIEILEGYASEKVWGVFHSITPEADDDEYSFEDKLRKILEMGFYISLNGIVTYKSAKLLRNVVLKILKSKFQVPNKDISPNDFYNAGFVFETDGPFLAPEGKRGELNEPANIKLIYESLSSQLL
ncbi:TatD family hydrolase [Candidatus Dojkabacteria bacterium]|nr:TatD family hydrolase [Candidatus Dojkabacteria bacterium]